MSWVHQRHDQAKSSRLYLLLKSGGAVAFVGSCFVMGGLITSHLIYRMRLWPKTGIVKTALLCNACFAIVWVGFYSGAFGLILKLLKEVI